MKKQISLITGILLLLLTSHGQNPQTAPEYQVKALFIFNFLKYVEWPPESFPSPETPITIGIIGINPFNGFLQNTVHGKTIGNRNVVVRPIQNTADLSAFHLIFISSSESYQLDRILKQTATLPVLTVGEDSSFADKGGIINFLLVGDKIRLEINLTNSRANRLQISSRLLSVADRVRGQ